MDKFDNIPQELRDRAQWLVWKLEHIEGKAKPAKLPHNARTGWKIDPTDKAGLSTFEKAVAAARTGKFDGIGYSFQPDDPYCGIDLDHSENQWIVERQNVIFDKIVSYTEISPSGNGAHIIVRGEIPIGLKTDIAELYSKERYLTFTGDVVRDEPIKFVNGALGELYDELRAYQATNSKARVSLDEFESKLTDEQVCTAAEQMTDGRFGLLWETAKSNSEKDMSFFVMLANAGADPLQAKRIFFAAPIGASVTRKGSAKTIENYLMVQTLPKAFNDVVKLLDLTAFIASGQAYLDKKRTLRLEIEQRRLDRMRDTRREKAEALAKRIEEKVSLRTIHEMNWEESPHSFSFQIKDDDNLPMPPGYFGQIYQYFKDQAQYPIDAVCLAGALTYVSTLCGRAHNVSRAGLNLYTLVLAPTGAGKDAARSGISKLNNKLSAQFREIDDLFKFRKPSSEGGIVTALGETKSVMFALGEFWSHYMDLSSSRNKNDIDIKSAYMEFYTLSGYGQQGGGSSRASKDNSTRAIVSPNLNIFAESVTGRFLDLVNNDSITDGLIPRFTVLKCNKAPLDDNENAEHVFPSAELVSMLATLKHRSIQIENLNQVVDVEFTDEAFLKQKAYKRCVRAWFLNGDEARGELWNRVHVKALKLAAILAVSEATHAMESDYKPVVTLEMLDWAIAIVNHSTSLLEDSLSSGEYGEGDSRAISDAKRFLVRYVTESVSEMSKRAGFDKKMHSDKVITTSFWKRGVGETAAFRRGLGPISNWIKVIGALKSEGAIIQMPDATVFKDYDTTADVWAINAANLL